MINGSNKKMIWRMGGVHNQFTLHGDTLGISYQHCAKWLPKKPGQANRHLLLFDNGNYHKVAESRAVEYEIDETAKTATLVWEHHHTPPTFALAMGSVDRMPNGNTFIGWGLSPDVAASEILPDGSVTFEMQLPVHVFSYRTPKYPLLTASVEAPSATPAFGLSPVVTASGEALDFITPSPTQVHIEVSDLLGRPVQQVFDGVSLGQPQRITLRTAGVPAGVYYAALRTASGTLVRPFVIAH